MASWIVRGGSHLGDAEQDFLESRSVGIYFGADQNIDGMSDAVLRREIQQFYIGWLAERNARVEQRRVQQVVTFYLNQVLKFRDDIRSGDTIVMPRKAYGGHRVAQGIVDGEYDYWGSEDYPHRRRVRWLEAETPRERIGHVWPPSDRRTVFRIDGG